MQLDINLHPTPFTHSLLGLVFRIPKDSPYLLEDPVLKAIAKKHNRSSGLVALRYQLQRGVVVLAKSFNEKRIKENFQVGRQSPALVGCSVRALFCPWKETWVTLFSSFFLCLWTGGLKQSPGLVAFWLSVRWAPVISGFHLFWSPSSNKIPLFPPFLSTFWILLTFGPT